MNLVFLLLAVTLTLFLFFFITRGFIHMEIGNILNKSTRKKLAKNQSFREWFFYKRYVNILPKSTLIWYYSNFVLYIICVIAVIVLCSIDKINIGRTVVWMYFCIYGVSLASKRFKI